MGEVKKVYPGGITQEQINAWTEKYGAPNEGFKVGEIQSLRDPSKKLVFYFQKPDKHVIAQSTSKMMPPMSDLPAAKQVMVTNCLIWADKDLQEDAPFTDQYMVSMGTLIGDSFEVPTASLAKI